MNKLVFISLGSNIDPEKHIKLAFVELSKNFHVVKKSKVYQSKAYGAKNHADYQNAAVVISTDIDPYELKFKHLRLIEEKLGRIRTENKFDDRTIDLDISLYGNEIINDPNLMIPDPGINRHAFLALPLADLDPDFIHPILKKSLKSIAIDFTNDLGYNINIVK